MNDQDLARRLGATTLFSHLPKEQLLALVQQSPRQKARAGSWLAAAATPLSEHLVLLSGELEARRAWTGPQGDEQSHVWRVGVAAAGAGVTVLSASSSHIHVRALADSEYLAIDGEQLDDLLGWSHLEQSLAMARHLKIFQRVPLGNVLQAFERMALRPVAADETIITQGELGDRYYIILSGEAGVWRTDPLTDETHFLTTLTAPDGFGEEALLVQGYRTATLKMSSPGSLLSLSKTDFEQLLQPSMAEEIDAERARGRLARGEAQLLDCRHAEEHQESRIPGALFVPLDQLRREGVFGLDPASTYIVYCRSGRRSIAASFLLRERGIRALSLTGGIMDWPFDVDSQPL